MKAWFAFFAVWLLFTPAITMGGENYSRAFLQRIVEDSCKQYGLPYSLVAALIQQESGWKHNALSSAGARGAMQLMPATGRRLGLHVSPELDERIVPEKAIPAGCRLLRSLLEQFQGDVSLALAAYNAGENAVKKYGGIPPYSETRNYVRSILAMLGRAPLQFTQPSVPIQVDAPSPEEIAEIEAGLSKSPFVMVR